MEQLTPEQIAQLQQDHESLKTSYAALEADHLKALEQIENLTKANSEQASGLSSLQSAVSTLESQIDAHKKYASETEEKLYAAEKTIAELKSKEAPEEKKAAPSFTYKGVKYEVIVPVVILPLIGKRTAREIAQDEKAQKYLVEVKGNIGTVIREVK